MSFISIALLAWNYIWISEYSTGSSHQYLVGSGATAVRDDIISLEEMNGWAKKGAVRSSQVEHHRSYMKSPLAGARNLNITTKEMSRKQRKINKGNRSWYKETGISVPIAMHLGSGTTGPGCNRGLLPDWNHPHQP